MNTPRIIAEIKEAVKHEMRVGMIMNAGRERPPMPHDIDAESELVSACLIGNVRPHELAPLKREHFYAHILGAIFEATIDVVEPGDLEAVKRNLVNMGWRGALDHEIQLTAFTQPWASLTRVRQLSQLVIELAEQRRVIERIQRVEVGLRTGELDRPSAARLLAEFAA